MAKKKKRKTFKFKVRIFVAVVVFGAVTSALGYNCLMNIVKIQELKNKKKSYEEEIISVREEKKLNETKILSLEDDEYFAKYVREKYFYSKDGELKLRLD